MQFVSGQTVVHAVHGPVTVTGIHTREHRGATIDYAELVEPNRQLRVSVPIARAEEIGIRPVLDATELDAIFDQLAAASVHHEGSWTRRMKDFEQRLTTREVGQKAIVVRELLRRTTSGPGSTSERSMLREAIAALSREIALGGAYSDDAAVQLIEDAVLRGTVPQRAAS